MFCTRPKRHFNFLVTFILSSANALNLNQSIILLFGKVFENTVHCGNGENAGNHSLLDPTKEKNNHLQHLNCRLQKKVQMLSIWSSQKFCHSVELIMCFWKILGQKPACSSLKKFSY